MENKQREEESAFLLVEDLEEQERVVEAVLFTIGMEFIGFWITAMAGTFVFLWTLKGEKKVNLIVAILFSVGLASLGYFGFTRGFVIPLPKGVLWESLGIPMP